MSPFEGDEFNTVGLKPCSTGSVARLDNVQMLCEPNQSQCLHEQVCDFRY